MKFNWKNPWFVMVVIFIALLLTACGKKEPDPLSETNRIMLESCVAKLHETKNFSSDTVAACQRLY